MKEHAATNSQHAVELPTLDHRVNRTATGSKKLCGLIHRQECRVVGGSCAGSRTGIGPVRTSDLTMVGFWLQHDVPLYRNLAVVS